VSDFVYVVMAGEYRELHVERIFANYDAAKVYESKLKARWEEVYVKQCEMDYSGEPSEQSAYTVMMARGDDDEPNEGRVENVSPGALWGIGVSRLRGVHFSASVMARNEAHAVEIVRGMRRELIAKDEW